VRSAPANSRDLCETFAYPALKYGHATHSRVAEFLVIVPHMKNILIALALLLLPSAAGANDTLLAHWTQMGPGGIAEARAVVSGQKCPKIGDLEKPTTIQMIERFSESGQFSRVCSALLPADLKAPFIYSEGFQADDDVMQADASDNHGHQFAVNVGWPVAPVTPRPQRIVVLGDTGCRIKPPALQDCNDIAKWPFPELAASAAKLKPDLVIHVGDYLYRESACPQGHSGCAGTPWGDNWPTWNADFFSPAAPLLAAAPWVIVRGNHEDCQRSGAGFNRLLAPLPYDPAKPCVDHFPAYAVPAGGMNLVVVDDAGVTNTTVVQNLVPAFQSDFASLATLAPAPLWLLMHQPIWGLVKGPLGMPVGGNPTMITAVGDRTALAPVSLLLAGHIHAFEAINYNSGLPPQILAGHGGDNLDVTPLDLKGAVFQTGSGVAVKDGCPSAASAFC
jgi:hypothetical protein